MQELLEGPATEGETKEASDPTYALYRSLDHMKPDSLVKEIKPSELRTWQFKYDQWVSAPFQGTLPPEVEVNMFMCYLDSWWQSRLRPRMRRDTCMEDLWKCVLEETSWAQARNGSILVGLVYKG